MIAEKAVIAIVRRSIDEWMSARSLHSRNAEIDAYCGYPDSGSRGRRHIANEMYIHSSTAKNKDGEEEEEEE